MTNAANLANLASNTNYGILNIYRGGTGIGEYTKNGVITFTGANTLTVMNLTPEMGGTGLTSFNAPGAMYALTSNTLTTGTLPVLSGGTGANTLANNALVVGHGIDPVYTIAPGTANNMLISDGTFWTAANPATVVDKLTLNVLGPSQAWSNVTTSRSSSTTYTNATGRPIMVSVSASGTTPTSSIKLTIANMQIDYATLANTTHTVQGIVTSNGTYSITVTGTVNITTWAELR